MKINFLICGTQKAGTTALYSYLKEHPEICMANQKEVHFFDNENIFQNQNIDYSYYHSFFTPSKKHKIFGEATPIYMYWDNAPKRIFQYNPNMKLIIILRNPIDRAYSHWNMERSRDTEVLSFSQAIRLEEQRCREALPNQHRIFSYIDRGYYVQQIRKLWTYFSKEQVLIIKSEDLKFKPNKTLEQISNFLQINPFPISIAKNIHAIKYISAMSKEDRLYLQQIYKYEILNLGRLLNWDCNSWL